MNDIFTKIMNLIEKETNIPILEKDLENWFKQDKDNEKIYEIYKLASKNRKL